jgi:hypothetical protein
MAPPSAQHVDAAARYVPHWRSVIRFNPRETPISRRRSDVQMMRGSNAVVNEMEF